LAQKYRMGLNFNVYVGDDTGLLKKVKMMYSYQTDIVGSAMSKGDLSFAELDEGEKELTEKQMAEKRQKQEQYSYTAKFDKDGQPLFKIMQKNIAAKQTGKFGKQVKHEGV
jgi:hypothetical protein